MRSHTMREIYLILLFIGLVQILPVPNSYAQFVQQFKTATKPEDVGFSSQGLQRLDKLISQYVKDGSMPNAVTFIARHGKIVNFKAYGLRDINANIKLEKDDIFRIASQTKAI